MDARMGRDVAAVTRKLRRDSAGSQPPAVVGPEASRGAGLDERMTKRAQLGMAMFLISEAVFFFLLILACAYFHALPRLYAPSGWILTALLLAGSVSVWRGWRWGAVALDAVFLVGLAGMPFAMLTAVLG